MVCAVPEATASPARHGTLDGAVARVRVFLAGATGVIGRRLVPMLIAAGHEVTGMTRSPRARARARRAREPRRASPTRSTRAP